MKGVIAALPYFVLIVIWWVIYKQAGFGAAHAGAYYVDPAEQPLAFLGAVVARLPVLLASQWGIIPADIYTLTEGDKQGYSLICGVFLLVVLIPIIALQRKDRVALFWAFGMLFSVLPALAASPYDRLLLFPGIGAAALLAGFIHKLWMLKERPHNPAFKYYSLFVFGVMFLFHLILSPLLMPVMTYSTKLMAQAVSDQPSYFESLDSINEDNIADKKLILFSPPLASSLAIAGLRFHRDAPIPERIWTITTLKDDMQFTVADNVLTLSRPNGFLDSATEQSVRNLAKYPFKPGDTVALSGLSIEVSQTNADGKPMQLKLIFDNPVNSAEYEFLQWNSERAEYETMSFPQPDH